MDIQYKNLFLSLALLILHTFWFWKDCNFLVTGYPLTDFLIDYLISCIDKLGSSDRNILPRSVGSICEIYALVTQSIASIRNYRSLLSPRACRAYEGKYLERLQDRIYVPSVERHALKNLSAWFFILCTIEGEICVLKVICLFNICLNKECVSFSFWYLTNGLSLFYLFLIIYWIF